MRHCRTVGVVVFWCVLFISMHHKTVNNLETTVEMITITCLITLGVLFLMIIMMGE